LIHFVIAIEMRFVLSQLRGKERREDVAPGWLRVVVSHPFRDETAEWMGHPAVLESF
jgi:hypothetical protein